MACDSAFCSHSPFSLACSYTSRTMILPLILCDHSGWRFRGNRQLFPCKSIRIPRNPRSKWSQITQASSRPPELGNHYGKTFFQPFIGCTDHGAHLTLLPELFTVWIFILETIGSFGMARRQKKLKNHKNCIL